MTTLNRLLGLALVLTLLATAYAKHTGMTHFSVGHDTYYFQKKPWLAEIHQYALYGLLGWSALFVRREPTLVRIGLIALIVAFVVVALPPKTETPSEMLKSVWH